jgi:hypothetical protein
MQDSVETVPQPLGTPWAPQSAAASSDAITQTNSAACQFLLGNVTGNGLLECGGGSTTLLDSVMVYPTAGSPSPFSPTVYTPPPAVATTTNLTVQPILAPVLTFGCNVAMTERTATLLDVVG